MLQGAVNVSVTAIIPSDRDTADVIPGDFSTVNADGEPEMRESAGKLQKKKNNKTSRNLSEVILSTYEIEHFLPMNCAQ